MNLDDYIIEISEIFMCGNAIIIVYTILNLTKL